MPKLALRVVAVASVIALLGAGSYAIAGDGRGPFRGTLHGYEENPDVSTTGTGTFVARLAHDGSSLAYELTYSHLEGTVTQAHVHFGKYAVNGGVSFFLCSNLNASAADDCPQAGTVSGTIRPADVIGPAPQGIEAGSLAEIVAAMRAGHAYANVHTTTFPGGEIRAQIDDRGGRGKHGGDR
jgi:hypothetical protein